LKCSETNDESAEFAAGEQKRARRLAAPPSGHFINKLDQTGKEIFSRNRVEMISSFDIAFK